LREDLAKEVEETNLMLVEDINQSNAVLAERVAIHNQTARLKVRLSKNGKRYTFGRNQTFARLRSYEDERRIYDREIRNKTYHMKAVPICVNSTFLTWRPNPYVSLGTIKELIEIVNAQTQRSPRSSVSE
jgi:hypothetical protein